MEWALTAKALELEPATMADISGTTLGTVGVETTAELAEKAQLMLQTHMDVTENTNGAITGPAVVTTFTAQLMAAVVVVLGQARAAEEAEMAV